MRGTLRGLVRVSRCLQLQLPCEADEYSTARPGHVQRQRRPVHRRETCLNGAAGLAAQNRVDSAALFLTGDSHFTNGQVLCDTFAHRLSNPGTGFSSLSLTVRTNVTRSFVVFGSAGSSELPIQLEMVDFRSAAVVGRVTVEIMFAKATLTPLRGKPTLHKGMASVDR